jgi:hypothetical protein
MVVEKKAEIVPCRSCCVDRVKRTRPNLSLSSRQAKFRDPSDPGRGRPLYEEQEECSESKQLPFLKFHIYLIVWLGIMAPPALHQLPWKPSSWSATASLTG